MKANVLALAFALSSALLAHDAWAFHAAADFAKPVVEGGGAGVFYLGTKKERGWTCTLCHVEAPGRIALQVTSEPPELALEQRYVPGTRYDVTVTLVAAGGELGAQNPQSNYNGLGATFVDTTGAPRGTVTAKADRFVIANFTTVFVSGNNPRETSWTFAWTPPAEPTGGETYFHLAVVDGNGGGKTGETFTDPFGDDVVMARFVLRESASTQAAAPATEPEHGGRWGDVSIAIALLVPSLVLGGGFTRRRRRAGSVDEDGRLASTREVACDSNR